MTLAQIYEKLKMENAASILKHGTWTGTTDAYQEDAIKGEFFEWYAAYVQGDINGDHGEIRELVQLANCCFKRIMAITGD